MPPFINQFIHQIHLVREISALHPTVHIQYGCDCMFKEGSNSKQRTTIQLIMANWQQKQKTISKDLCYSNKNNNNMKPTAAALKRAK